MRSGFERSIKANLNRKKLRFEYEPFPIAYTFIAQYLPDFVFDKKDGTKMFVEAKGYLKPSDRRKMKAVKDSNPTLDIRFLFQQDNFMTKSKKTKYSDWAFKNGFKFHIGDNLPKEWIKEIR